AILLRRALHHQQERPVRFLDNATEVCGRPKTKSVSERCVPLSQELRCRRRQALQETRRRNGGRWWRLPQFPQANPALVIKLTPLGFREAQTRMVAPVPSTPDDLDPIDAPRVVAIRAEIT